MSTPQPTATYLRRPPRETTAASAAADPTDPDRPVVDTEAAAEALRTTTATLHRLAQAGIVTPTRVDTRCV
jgi:hypothetical protein